MRSLVVYGDAEVDPGRVAPRDRALLARARDERASLLCVYTTPGDVLSFGRYHAIPPTTPAPGIRVLRRLGGGRATPLGNGFVGVSLCLPHRSALVADEPRTLSPEQVLNRAVRGLLGAFGRLGVDASYPGRDVVTVKGRIAAALGFEVGPRGETIVEMAVATGRSFADVTRLADRADPTGTVAIDFLSPEQATCIADETGSTPDLVTMMSALEHGFSDRLDLRCARAPDVLPVVEPDPAWIAAGAIAPHLDHHARARQMLGVLDAYAALAAGRIGDVRIGGDIIAPSATIERMEAALRGAAPDRGAVVDRIRTAASGPDDFVLGVRSLDAIADVVVEACRS